MENSTDSSNYLNSDELHNLGLIFVGIFLVCGIPFFPIIFVSYIFRDI